jgi:hypothetical protein
VKKCLGLIAAILLAAIAIPLIADTAGKTISWRLEGAQLSQIIHEDPVYSGVRIELMSAGCCVLRGSVDSQEEYDRLFSQVSAAFGGDDQAKFRVKVRIKRPISTGS